MGRQPVDRPPEAVLDALASETWLDELPAADRAQVALASDYIALTAGEALFHQGDRPDGLYRLIAGRLDVVQEDAPGGPRRIGGLRPGMWVGELGLLTGDPHRNTIRARRDAVLERLDLPAAQALLDQVPRFREALTRDAVRRVASPPREATPRVYALVPASHGAPVRPVATALLSALGRRAALVGPEDVADVRDDPAALGRRLDRIEAESSTVLLVAESADDPWAARVRRSADRVLAIARAGARRHAPSRDQDLASTWLLLVHPDDGSRPQETADWRRTWPVPAIHHLRLGRRDDAARIARHLTGRAIGLVLGGGAGRGLAHLGVLQAFEEEGVPVDVVVGTSMGAILGAQIALGRSADTIVDRMRKEWIGGQALDLAMPIVSIARKGPVQRAMRRVVGRRQFEDLWIPFGCVSTSLRRARMVTHTRGDLVDAVYASSALPGVFPPADVDGDLLVDGAFVDNLPTRLARQLGASRLVAVNVLPAIDPVFTRPRGMKRVKALLRRYAPWSPDRQPLLMDIVLRAYFVPTVLQQDEARAEVDLFLEPPVGGFGFFDLREKTFEAVVRAGYHEGLRGLRMLRAREPGALSP